MATRAQKIGVPYYKHTGELDADTLRADLTGTDPERAARALKELEARGELDLNNPQIAYAVGTVVAIQDQQAASLLADMDLKVKEVVAVSEAVIDDQMRRGLPVNAQLVIGQAMAYVHGAPVNTNALRYTDPASLPQVAQTGALISSGSRLGASVPVTPVAAAIAVQERVEPIVAAEANQAEAKAKAEVEESTASTGTKTDVSKTTISSDVAGTVVAAAVVVAVVDGVLPSLVPTEAHRGNHTALKTEAADRVAAQKTEEVVLLSDQVAQLFPSAVKTPQRKDYGALKPPVPVATTPADEEIDALFANKRTIVDPDQVVPTVVLTRVVDSRTGRVDLFFRKSVPANNLGD